MMFFLSRTVLSLMSICIHYVLVRLSQSIACPWNQEQISEAKSEVQNQRI